jgi:hypothetical protein
MTAAWRRAPSYTRGLLIGAKIQRESLSKKRFYDDVEPTLFSEPAHVDPHSASAFKWEVSDDKNTACIVGPGDNKIFVRSLRSSDDIEICLQK